MADGKLTAMGAKKESRPGFHSDGGGLYLKVGEGRKSWVFRYKRKGKPSWLGLGAFDDKFGLAQAREAAAHCREHLRQGVDPLDAREEARAKIEAEKAAKEQDAARTFKMAATAFIAAKKAGWKNAKHADQWTSTLETYVYPIKDEKGREIGEKPVKEVTFADVLGCLSPIWEKKTETASRVRGRIENVLDYAAVQGWREGDNPARWKGRLQHTLAAPAEVKEVEHFPAVPWAALPPVMAKLAESEGIAARCLRFLTLTAVRSNEARAADWSEIDLAAKIWIIGGERMKGRKSQKREHRVPLVDAAIAILKSMLPPGAEKPESGLVFPSAGKKGQIQPFSDVALSKALHVAGAKGYTVHGLRSTFRDWCAERTSYPREIAEAALHHKNKDESEAAYLRTDHLVKRRRLMQAWADYATSTKPEGANVTELRRA